MLFEVFTSTRRRAVLLPGRFVHARRNASTPTPLTRLHCWLRRRRDLAALFLFPLLGDKRLAVLPVLVAAVRRHQFPQAPHAAKKILLGNVKRRGWNPSPSHAPPDVAR